MSAARARALIWILAIAAVVPALTIGLGIEASVGPVVVAAVFLIAAFVSVTPASDPLAAFGRQSGDHRGL